MNRLETGAKQGRNKELADLVAQQALDMQAQERGQLSFPRSPATGESYLPWGAERALAVMGLTDSERVAVVGRLEGRSFGQVAVGMGLSRQRVHQLERSGMRRMGAGAVSAWHEAERLERGERLQERGRLWADRWGCFQPVSKAIKGKRPRSKAPGRYSSTGCPAR